MAEVLDGKGGNVTRVRAADDFTAIRARMEQLRLERDRTFARPEGLSIGSRFRPRAAARGWHHSKGRERGQRQGYASFNALATRLTAVCLRIATSRR